MSPSSSFELPRVLSPLAFLLCLGACSASLEEGSNPSDAPQGAGNGGVSGSAGEPSLGMGNAAGQGGASPENPEDLSLAGAAGAGGQGTSMGAGGSAAVAPAVPDEPLANLFSDLLGIPQAEVDAKLDLAVRRIFGIGTGEPATPVQNSGYRLYYTLPQDPNMAFIWTPDTEDIRSEGMSYGMMIAVQMDLQGEFDRLWRFAKTFMQHPADSGLTSWRYYFRWVGRVNTEDANNWAVTYGANTGPAPDGEEYFAAALYLADRRWGSGGAFNYRQDADDVARAMLDNPRAGVRTPVIHPEQDMVVFYPNGGS